MDVIIYIQTDFHTRMRGKFNERQCESDLYKSQKVCHQLHCEDGVDGPEFQFFWPSKAVDEEDEDREDLVEDTFSVRLPWFYRTSATSIASEILSLICRLKTNCVS